jgi:hydrogenase maturation protein HypF
MPVASFEGEAPMKLESLVTKPVVESHRWDIDKDMVLDLLPLMARLTQCDAVEGANLFHGTLAAALLDWVQKATQRTGIDRITLCGGCFFNKVLREQLVQGMMVQRITPLLPLNMSPGDTAIALGQAYAAALKIRKDKD